MLKTAGNIGPQTLHVYMYTLKDSQKKMTVVGGDFCCQLAFKYTPALKSHRTHMKTRKCFFMCYLLMYSTTS